MILCYYMVKNIILSWFLDANLGSYVAIEKKLELIMYLLKLTTCFLLQSILHEAA